MMQFFIGAAIGAAVVGAAGSADFKRFVNKSRGEVKRKFDYAKEYIAAIDRLAKEQVDKKTKTRKSVNDGK
ncbi:MAG: hypothetical protein LBE89_06720 [Helicobacteraceae bacterium]|jgi:hypothetical protein|nr:hypothetical protein [Helicobacteraceae bacterium]